MIYVVYSKAVNQLKNYQKYQNGITSNVNSLYRLFKGCTKLTDFSDISKWDMSQVTSLRSVFEGCTSAKSLQI